MADFIFPVTPSPDDPRDLIYEHCRIRNRANQVNRDSVIDAKVPKTLDLRKYLNLPRNQGKRGTCASFASAAIKEYHERLDCNFCGYFSPESVYFYRSNKPEEGMFLRDVMQILQKNGIAYEADFPYNKESEPEQVPEKALNIMPDFKITSYAQINSIDGLKEALFNYGPCLMAFPVYDNRPEFWRVKSDPTRNGGHAVAVVGYNNRGFIIRNSWGWSWNGDGTVIYPYSEWGVHWEVWTAIDEDSPHKFPNETFRQKISKLLVCLQ